MPASLSSVVSAPLSPSRARNGPSALAGSVVPGPPTQDVVVPPTPAARCSGNYSTVTTAVSMVCSAHVAPRSTDLGPRRAPVAARRRRASRLATPRPERDPAGSPRADAGIGSLGGAAPRRRRRRDHERARARRRPPRPRRRRRPARAHPVATPPRAGSSTTPPRSSASSTRRSRSSPSRLDARRRRHVAAIGITNQRETTVALDRADGRALAPAIVWQDRRTARACDALAAAGRRGARARAHRARRSTRTSRRPRCAGCSTAGALDARARPRRCARSTRSSAGT